MDTQSIKNRFGIIGNSPALNYALRVAVQKPARARGHRRGPEYQTPPRGRRGKGVEICPKGLASEFQQVHETGEILRLQAIHDHEVTHAFSWSRPEDLASLLVRARFRLPRENRSIEDAGDRRSVSVVRGGSRVLPDSPAAASRTPRRQHGTSLESKRAGC